MLIICVEHDALLRLHLRESETVSHRMDPGNQGPFYKLVFLVIDIMGDAVGSHARAHAVAETDTLRKLRNMNVIMVWAWML